MLILGKRYGSISRNTGISYAEMEYDYAKSKDIPFLVFVIDKAVELLPEKIETGAEKAAKLKLFRNKAMNNTLATIRKMSDELVGALATSIMKAKNEIARPGWQRGTDYGEVSLRREIIVYVLRYYFASLLGVWCCRVFISKNTAANGIYTGEENSSLPSG